MTIFNQNTYKFHVYFRGLLGFVTLKHLTKKLVSQNHQFNSGIEKVVFRQYRRVNPSTELGLVARILEIDDFVAVVNGSNHCIGVITHMDLLNFASHPGFGNKVNGD